MKHKALEWGGALLLGGAAAATQYGIARLFGHSDSDWADVVMAGAILFQAGKSWGRG